MKKELIIALIIILVIGFFIEKANALSSDLKEEYSKSETIVFKLIGNILEPIEQKNVKIVKAGYIQEIPVEYELKKLNETYFIWAISPKTEGNYTFIIKNISTTLEGIPKKVEFRQNFSIIGNISSYNIKPGAIISYNDFSVKVNLFKDEDEKIEVDYPEKREIILKPGENTIGFSMKDESEISIKDIKIGKYVISAYLIGNPANANKGIPLKFLQGRIREEIDISNEKKTFTFNLINEGKDKIEDIEIEYPKNYFILSPDEKIDLDDGESMEYNLTLKNNDKIAIRETLYAVSEKIRIGFPVSIDFVEKREVNLSGDKVKIYRCSELGGKICKGEETCKGIKNNSLEGQCCIGSCLIEEKDTSGTKILGYVLIVLVILGLAYLYWKYKKTKPADNILEKKVNESNKNIP